MTRRRISRRAHLRHLAGAGAALTLALAPLPARAGRTIALPLDSAPFPIRGKPYRDRTVHAYLPDTLRRADTIDLVLYFHGHLATATDALATKHLREQLEDSGRRALLVVPQLATNARDSHAGRLERPGGLRNLVMELLQALSAAGHVPAGVAPGALALAAHSGGFQAAARCVERGALPVREVYLFDALYGFSRPFGDWLAGAPERRLISYHTGTPTVSRWTERLQSRLDRRRVAWRSEPSEGQLSRSALSAARAVFIRTGLPHVEVPWRTNALRDCLLGSSLAGPETGWRGDTRSPRPIERRS